MYLLDTNTLIYFFKGQGSVAEHLLALSPQQIAIPSIVLFELEYGIARSSSPEKRASQLKELVSLIQVLPFTSKEAQMAAQLRAELARTGQPIGPFDVLIAGTALAHQAILVTRNEKEFGRVSGLKIENWY